MSLSNLFEGNHFNLYASTLDGKGVLTIGKNPLTTGLHLGDTATPVYINEQLYSDGGSLSLAPVGSVPNANGMTLTGGVLNLQPASASFSGTLNYYEEYSITLPMTGCASLNLVCTFVRVGKLVTLSWNGTASVATTLSGQLSTLGGVIPARFLKTNMSAVVPVVDGNLSVSIGTGNLFFLSGGNINFTGANNGNFTYPGYCGLISGAMSYSI